jgi:hypothetical protein
VQRKGARSLIAGVVLERNVLGGKGHVTCRRRSRR